MIVYVMHTNADIHTRRARTHERTYVYNYSGRTSDSIEKKNNRIMYVYMYIYLYVSRLRFVDGMRIAIDQCFM